MTLRSAMLLVIACLGACGPDAADGEYNKALRGDEDGSSYSDRVAHLDRAIALEPKRARYWQTRAVLRIDHGDFAAARADLDRAIALEDRPYLRFLRGLVLCQASSCEDALPDLDLAIAQQPDNAQFYRARSLARTVLGQPEQGLADAEQLVRLAPQAGRSYYARGAALAALGRHPDAIDDFSESLRRMPELIHPRVARAASYDATGQVDKATADRAEADNAMAGSMCGYCLDPFRY